MIPEPSGSRLKTHPKGLAVVLFPGGICLDGHASPFLTGKERGCEVELAGAYLLDAEGVEEPLGEPSIGKPEHPDGGKACQGRPGLRVHVAHEKGAVGPREGIEARPLGKDLPELHVVALAGALLLGLPHVAVEDAGTPCRAVPGRPLYEHVVRELRPVVGEDRVEEPAEAIHPHGLLQRVQGPRSLLCRLPPEKQHELELAGPEI